MSLPVPPLNNERDQNEAIRALYRALAGIDTGGPGGGSFAPLSHTHLAADISNSSAVGRALLTAVDVVAQRTALGLGSAALSASSDFAAASHTHPASAISDSTAAGRQLLTAADVAAQRTALGLGTAATQASSSFAAASHTHTTAQVSDFAESVDDRVAALLVAGANVTLTYNDVANTLTVAATGGSGSSNPVYTYKNADQTAIGINYADITQLTFSVAANTDYAFEFYIIADADAATTGIDVAVNGPAAPTSIVYTQKYWTSATAVTERGANAYDANTANGGSAGTARRIFEVRGILRNGANAGTLAARIKRENVGTGPNVRAGSWGKLTTL